MNKGIMIDSNTIKSNLACMNGFGNVIISCEPFLVTNKFSHEAFGDTSSYNEYFLHFADLRSNLDTGFYHQKMYNNFLKNETLFANNTSIVTVESTEVDISKVIIKNNIVENNYAVLSNGVFLQGTSRAILTNNKFYGFFLLINIKQ